MDWIAEQLAKLFGPGYLLSFVRRGMAALSGYLIMAGGKPEDVTNFTDSGTQVISAVILYLSAEIWSALKEKKLKAGKG